MIIFVLDWKCAKASEGAKLNAFGDEGYVGMLIRVKG